MKISKYKHVLKPHLYANLAQAHRARESGEGFAAAVWGGVVTEGLLFQMVDHFEIKLGKRADQHGVLQSFSNQNTMVPDEIMKRFDEIRLIRNRLVHDTGLDSSTSQTDAATILVGLHVILDWWYSQTSVEIVEPIEKAQSEDGIPIFLSTITPHTVEQTMFIDRFIDELERRGLVSVRVEFDHFDQRDPLKKVTEVIQRCAGVIVLGLEKSHSYYVRDKEGSQDPREEIHRKYTSGWLHLEAGLAHVLEKEIFVICQSDIHSDGIFDRSWNSYAVCEINELDINEPNLQSFLRAISQWSEKLQGLR